MMGLGFAGPNIAVDTHCNTRGRVARNLAAMKSLEATQGICVDEDTAIFLDDNVGTVYGSNGVTIADTSTAIFSEGTHFTVSGAKLTYLTSGDHFDFHTKSATSSKTLITIPYYDTEYQSDNILGSNEITKSITHVVDSAAPYILGKAPAPVRKSGTSYGQEAQTFSFKFYRNEQTTGYFRDGAYTAVDVLIDIY
jgi:cyanophycinase